MTDCKVQTQNWLADPQLVTRCPIFQTSNTSTFRDMNYCLVNYCPLCFSVQSRPTDSKRWIWAHHAKCTCGLNKYAWRNLAVNEQPTKNHLFATQKHKNGNLNKWSSPAAGLVAEAGEMQILLTLCITCTAFISTQQGFPAIPPPSTHCSCTHSNLCCDLWNGTAISVHPLQEQKIFLDLSIEYGCLKVCKFEAHDFVHNSPVTNMTLTFLHHLDYIY